MKRLALLLIVMPAVGFSAGSDLDRLLAGIVRPAPASTAFVEAHFSPLLTRPLVISGTLEYLGPDELARTVEKPYHERSEIRGDTATVQREGEPARSFSLERAPEMRGLLTSFTDLLGGNRAGLEQGFVLDLHGSSRNWTLGLTPRDPRVLEQIRSIIVIGNGAQPRCLATYQANDDTTIMLLARAATTALPAAPDRAWFDAQCHGHAG